MLALTHGWKVVDSPKRQQAGVYLVANDDTKTYSALSVTDLEQLVGLQTLPGMPRRVRDTTVELPEKVQVEKPRTVKNPFG